jgi:hypothetical protein
MNPLLKPLPPLCLRRKKDEEEEENPLTARTGFTTEYEVNALSIHSSICEFKETNSIIIDVVVYF